MDKFFRNFIVILFAYLFVFSLTVLDFGRLKSDSVSAEELAFTVDFGGVTTPYNTFSEAFSDAIGRDSSIDNPAVITVPTDVLTYVLTVPNGSFIKIVGISPDIKITRKGLAQNLFIVEGSLTLENITLLGGAIYTYNGETVDYPYPNSSTSGTALKSLIQINASGSLNLESNSTIKNCAYAGKGGAINLDGGRLQLNGGRITASKGGNGGAVYMLNGAIFNFNSGIIDNNYASTRAGAIFNSCTTGGLYLSSGIIENNVSNEGGGLYLSANTKTFISGSPVVCGNKNESGEANNIFASVALIAEGVLSSDANLGITMASNDTSFFNGATEDHLNIFFSDNTNKRIKLSEGYLTLEEKVIIATVSFVTNNDDTLDDISICDTAAAIEAPSLSKKGYYLDGWYDNDNIKWNFEDYVTENMTLTAKWIFKAPLLSAILCNSEETEEISINADKENKIVSIISSHEIEEATFEFEWEKDGVKLGTYYSLNLGAKADQGLYKVKVRAIYGEEISDYVVSNTLNVKTYYTVSFSDGERSSFSQDVYEDYATEPSASSKDGFEFIGWRTDVNGEQNWDFENFRIETNLNLFACWKLLSPTFVNIETDKAKTSILEGETLTLTASFSHALNGVWNYVWYKNGVVIDGAVNSSITISKPEESGAYSCGATFTYDEQTESANSVALNVSVLKKKLTAEVFDEEKSEGLSATLEADSGIDPEANLIIEEANKDNIAFLNFLTEGQEVDIVYSIEMQKQDESVNLPDSSTLSLIIDMEDNNNAITKIILIKPDNTWEEIETTTEDGKLIFTTDSLGRIAIISNTNLTVSNPQTIEEDTQTEDSETNSDLITDIENADIDNLSDNNLTQESGVENETDFDLSKVIFPLATVFVVIAAVVIIFKLKRKNKLKI